MADINRDRDNDNWQILDDALNNPYGKKDNNDDSSDDDKELITPKLIDPSQAMNFQGKSRMMIQYWIRIFYGHPQHFVIELINIMVAFTNNYDHFHADLSDRMLMIDVKNPARAMRLKSRRVPSDLTIRDKSAQIIGYVQHLIAVVYWSLAALIC